MNIIMKTEDYEALVKKKEELAICTHVMKKMNDLIRITIETFDRIGDGSWEDKWDCKQVCIRYQDRFNRALERSKQLIATEEVDMQTCNEPKLQ